MSLRKGKETGKQVILDYLRQHLGEWVSNEDLRTAAHKKGLLMTNDVPRTVRLLRQEGWQIQVRGDGYVMLTSLERKIARGERKPLSEKVRYQVLSRDGFKCKACGRGSNNGVKLHVDHMVPVDWGGKSELSNYITLCEECNRGKKAWTDSAPSEQMNQIMSKRTVEGRIEALFDAFPNQDIPSAIIQVVSKGARDWQRALRRIRQRTGKRIKPSLGRTAYRYEKE